MLAASVGESVVGSELLVRAVSVGEGVVGRVVTSNLLVLPRQLICNTYFSTTLQPMLT